MRMTTESKPTRTTQVGEPTTDNIFAEGRLNRERWQRDCEKIREQHPNHWITIFDGGRKVVGFDNKRAHFNHLNQLQGLIRSGAFTWPPRRPAGTRSVPSVRRQRRS